MQGKKKKKKVVLKKWVRIFITIILFFLALLFLFNIIDGLNPKTEKETYYTYKIHRDIDYKVYLKENSFFEEEYLEKDKQYTTELIDYIDIDFNYLFSGSKLTDINYKYNINAELVGEYEEGEDELKEIWNKKYTLLDTQSINKNDSIFFNLKQNLKLNYSKYNKEANNFKTSFKLAIDAKLVVKLNIEYTGVIEDTGKKVRGVDTLYMTIPLSKSTMSITTKYDDDNKKVLTEETNELRDIKKVYINFALLLLVIIIYITNKNKLIIDKKTNYTKTYNKIMKSYADIIVEISNLANLEDLEILDIKNFDDMVDAEEELKSPILLYEIEKNKESWFIIVNGKYAYRYILNGEIK